MNTPLVILAGVRTPFTRIGTTLAELSAGDLGRHAVASLLTQTGIDPGEVDEVIFGCVGQPADAVNLARVIALRAGVPTHVPAATVHRNCASGMEALTSAHQRAAAGMGELFIVGGTESMSNYPLLYKHSAVEKFADLAHAKSVKERMLSLAHFRPSDFSPLVGLRLGLSDPVSGLNMGETAEVLANEFNISRESQDAFANWSHQKARLSRSALNREIDAVHHDGQTVETDNGIREDSTLDKLSQLKPVFETKTGTVTAGNASQITDGAVALLVATEARAEQLGIQPIGKLVGYAYTGCVPKRMGLGPVKAIHAANAQTGLTLEDASLVEINEAFAAQVLAVLKGLRDPKYSNKAGLDMPLGEIPDEKLNRQGGSIALGHPVGATGARLVLTALKQLQDLRGRYALTTLCVGGGQGAALWLERP